MEDLFILESTSGRGGGTGRENIKQILPEHGAQCRDQSHDPEIVTRAEFMLKSEKLNNDCTPRCSYPGIFKYNTRQKAALGLEGPKQEENKIFT